MRRRAKKLEVSTFPFLAVLLCCMGSLILILLVMDRKGKLAARYKAQQELAHAMEDADRAAAERKATRAAERAAARDHMLSQARAEWEVKRDTLHARLAEQEEELQARLNQMQRQLADATEKHQAARAKLAVLHQQARTEQAKVKDEEQALAGSRGKVDAATVQSAQARALLAKMTADLAQLEQALHDLREAKKLEGQTYSVVPYHGKHGDTRRPLYVECATNTGVFQPGHKAVHVGDTDEVRAETQRRIARQREQLAKAKQPIQTPYLMLLVRPNGVDTYYALQRALHGLEVDFGYEFVDPEWVLDFPEEELPAPQPWMTVHNDPVAPAAPGSPESTTTMPRGLKPSGGPLGVVGGGIGPGGSATATLGVPGAKGSNASGLLGGTMTATNGGTPGVERRGTGGNSSGSGIAVGLPGTNPGTPQPRGAPENLFPASTVHNGSGGNGSGGNGIVGTGSGGNGSGGSGGRIAFGQERPGIANGDYSSSGLGNASGTGSPSGQKSISGVPSGSSTSTSGAENLFSQSSGTTGVAGSNNNRVAVANGGQGGQGNGVPGSAQASQGGAAGSVQGGTAGNGRGGTAGTGPGGASGVTSSQKGAAGNGQGGAVGTGPGGMSGTTAPQNGAAPFPDGTTVQPGTPLPRDPGSVVALPHVVESPPATNSGQNGSSSGGGGPAGSGASNDGSGESASVGSSRFAPPQPAPLAKPQPRRSIPLRAARLSDRDWIIYIECRADSLVVYPSRQQIFVKDLIGDPPNNPLLVAVQQMINRKQATLRPEETPYRPQVRFLLRPENLRTLHAAYPALEALPVPKTRQNLEPEDDPALIAAGY
jgi:hypothetical protein